MSALGGPRQRSLGPLRQSALQRLQTLAFFARPASIDAKWTLSVSGRTFVASENGSARGPLTDGVCSELRLESAAAVGLLQPSLAVGEGLAKRRKLNVASCHAIKHVVAGERGISQPSKPFSLRGKGRSLAGLGWRTRPKEHCGGLVAKTKWLEHSRITTLARRYEIPSRAYSRKLVRNSQCSNPAKAARGNGVDQRLCGFCM